MISGNRKWLFAIAAIAFLAPGCAAVDNFSSRATQFNIETEQAQNEILLLNIVRASKRRPREFTALQTVTGTASATGGLTLSVPFGRNNGANALGINSSASGGPTFAMSVLDTQEFYQGIMKPIPTATIDFYVHQRYPKPLLFNLLLSEVVIRQEGGVVLEIPNYPGEDAEAVKLQASGYGPIRTEAEVADLSNVARAAAAGLDVEQVAWCSLSKDDWHAVLRRLKLGTVKPPGAGAKAQFCFGVPLASGLSGSTFDLFDGKPGSTAFQLFLDGLATTKIACGTNRRKARKKEKAKGGDLMQTAIYEWLNGSTRSEDGQGFTGFTLPEKLIATLTANTGVKIDAKKTVKIEFVPRSTEAVLYYLGEVMRRWVEPDLDTARVIAFHYGSPRKELPLTECKTRTVKDETTGFRCEPLFVVERGGREPFVSVDYDGTRYSIPNDPAVAGRSSLALNILKQLIALNRSAKDTLATSVFSVINP